MPVAATRAEAELQRLIVEAYSAAASTLHRYPDGGSAALRGAIAKRFNLDADRIVCGAGSDEIISLLIRSYAGPGDEVLYSQYGFLMYPIGAKSVGATPVTAPEDGLTASVDSLLARTEARDVASLDEAIAGRTAWDPDNPLRLEMVDPDERTLLRTPRVGLTLKRMRKAPEPPRFLMRNYRFLSEPRRISKGKPHMVLSMYAAGAGVDQITLATGCPKGTVARYAADYEAGLLETDFGPYFGAELGTKEICRLYGAWNAHWGSGAPSK